MPCVPDQLCQLTQGLSLASKRFCFSRRVITGSRLQPLESLVGCIPCCLSVSARTLCWAFLFCLLEPSSFGFLVFHLEDND